MKIIILNYRDASAHTLTVPDNADAELEVLEWAASKDIHHDEYEWMSKWNGCLADDTAQSENAREALSVEK